MEIKFRSWDADRQRFIDRLISRAQCEQKDKEGNDSWRVTNCRRNMRGNDEGDSASSDANSTICAATVVSEYPGRSFTLSTGPFSRLGRRELYLHGKSLLYSVNYDVFRK